MAINDIGKLDFPENPVLDDVFVDDENIQWKFSGVKWDIFEPYYLNDLPDVDITDIKDNELIEWDGTNMVNSGSSEISLQDLNDVDIVSIIDNDLLKWDGNNWVDDTIKQLDFCSVYVYFITNPNIGVTNPYLIKYNTEYDNNNIWDNVNSKAVIKNTGIYMIQISYAYITTGSGSPIFNKLIIYDINGNEKENHIISMITRSTNNSPSEPNYQYALIYVQLDATDYVRGYNVRPRRLDNTNGPQDSYENKLIIEQIS